MEDPKVSGHIHPHPDIPSTPQKKPPLEFKPLPELTPLPAFPALPPELFAKPPNDNEVIYALGVSFLLGAITATALAYSFSKSRAE